MDESTQPLRAGTTASRNRIVIAACLVLPLSSGLASAKDGLSPSGIGSVWASDTSCGHFTSAAKTRHPDEAAIKASGRTALAGLDYVFSMPDLPEFAGASLILASHDRSRGGVDHYVLIAPDDTSPPVAAVVVTELPESLVETSPHDILTTIAGLQAGNAVSLPDMPVTFTRTTGASGPAIEMLVLERTGSHCYPTAHFTMNASAHERTLGISRFTVDGRYLLEYSLIHQWPGTAGFDAVTSARATMRRFAESLSRPERAEEMHP